MAATSLRMADVGNRLCVFVCSTNRCSLECLRKTSLTFLPWADWRQYWKTWSFLREQFLEYSFCFSSSFPMSYMLSICTSCSALGNRRGGGGSDALVGDICKWKPDAKLRGHSWCYPVLRQRWHFPIIFPLDYCSFLVWRTLCLPCPGANSYEVLYVGPLFFPFLPSVGEWWQL